jgi:hypothetical protein
MAKLIFEYRPDAQAVAAHNGNRAVLDSAQRQARRSEHEYGCVDWFLYEAHSGPPPPRTDSQGGTGAQRTRA